MILFIILPIIGLTDIGLVLSRSFTCPSILGMFVVTVIFSLLGKFFILIAIVTILRRRDSTSLGFFLIVFFVSLSEGSVGSGISHSCRATTFRIAGGRAPACDCPFKSVTASFISAIVGSIISVSSSRPSSTFLSSSCLSFPSFSGPSRLLRFSSTVCFSSCSQCVHSLQVFGVWIDRLSLNHLVSSCSGLCAFMALSLWSCIWWFFMAFVNTSFAVVYILSRDWSARRRGASLCSSQSARV